MKFNIKRAGLLAGMLMSAQLGLAAPMVQAQGVAPQAQRLYFARGATTITQTGVLRFGGADRYVLKLQANQIMSVGVRSAGNNVILIVWGQDGTVLMSDHAGSPNWEGTTPSNQDYYLDVRAVNGTSANYTLSIYANPVNSGPAVPSVMRISFAPGAVSSTLVGKVRSSVATQYVLKANGGQRMTVNVVRMAGAGVVLSVVGANGDVLLSSMPGADGFSGILPSSQDYYLKITSGSNQPSTFRLTVSVVR